MKYKIIFGIIFALFLISLTSAWSNTTFYNGTGYDAVHNITFSGNQNKSFNITIPSTVTTLTNARFNLTYSFAKVNYTFTFIESNLSVTNPEYLIDGNYGTAMTSSAIGGTYVNISFNSSKNIYQIKAVNLRGAGGSTGSKVEVDFKKADNTWEAIGNFTLIADTTLNLTLSYNNNTNTQYIRFVGFGGGSFASWDEIEFYGVDSGGSNNVSIDLGGNGYDFYYTISNVTSSGYTTTGISLLTLINNYIPTCSYVGGFCRIPLIFNSQSGGTIQYSDIVLNDLGLIENSQNYSLSTTEGAVENFSINLTVGSGNRVTTANLVYNGTAYSATVSGSTILLRTLTIPDVTTSTYKNFYWSINLDDGSQVNTTFKQQYVNVFGIDDCSVYANQLFNITMYDEDSQTLLSGGAENTSIKLSFTISSTNNVPLLNYSKSFAYTNPARVCLQNALNTTMLRLDGLFEYSSTGRFTEYYNFQNYNLNNATSNVKISLYDLNSSKGQEFKITYKDSNFVPVSGAIMQIQRKYVDEGVFKTTEIPKTGTEGYTIGHLIRNDAIYNIIILKDGIVLATFTDIVADCQNPLLSSCAINLNSFGSSVLPASFSTVDDITFTLTFNRTTREVKSIYSIISGVTSTVLLNVTLFDSLGMTEVCSDSLVSSGGQLTCTVPASFGNSTITAKLYKDGLLIGQGIISLAENPSNLYGSNLIFLALLVLVVILGIGASSDSPMIMGLIMAIGLIILITMNLVYSPSFFGVGATVLWFIVSIVLVLIKGSNRQ